MGGLRSCGDCLAAVDHAGHVVKEADSSRYIPYAEADTGERAGAVLLVAYCSEEASAACVAVAQLVA